MDLSRLCNPSDDREGRLGAARRDMASEYSAASLSFIGILESRTAMILYNSESITELLGYEPNELVKQSVTDIVHPDDLEKVQRIIEDVSLNDKVACLAYFRIKHKESHKGYVLCCASNVGDYMVGGVSAATSPAKAMINASTASEVHIISPSASQFEYRRWNDPTPSSSAPISPVDGGTPPPSAGSSHSASSLPSPVPSGNRSPLTSSPTTSPLQSPLLPSTLPRAPKRAVRTALILGRFTEDCTVEEVVNPVIFPRALVVGRSFYDFVSREDERKVRSFIDIIKEWGVNERGSPSDGGFGFNKFSMVLTGRNSSIIQPDITPSRHRHTPPGAVTLPSHPYRDDRLPSTSQMPPMSPTERTPTSSLSRPRIQRAATERGVSSPAARNRDRDRDRDRSSDELAVEAIFSPHSDGILVVLRPAT